MKSMVITYGTDGSIRHTLKDSFFNPAPEGTKRRIVRMTEILFDESAQEFYIRWCIQPFFGQVHRRYIATALSENRLPHIGEEFGEPITRSRVGFPTYEDAVAAELAAVDTLRLIVPGFASEL